MKKIILCCMMICVVLMGCDNGSDSLKNFTEDQLKQESTAVLDEFHKKEYDKVVMRFPEELRANLTGNQFQEAWDTNFPDAGNFVEYKEFTYAEKEENGFIVVKATYENKDVQYTISFDKEMQLTNFFMK